MKYMYSLLLPMLLGSFAQAQVPGAFSLQIPETRTIRLNRSVLPSVYDYQRLGVFCKLDVQLEKHLPLPVRFRLGDPLLVDAWEGKGPLQPHATLRH